MKRLTLPVLLLAITSIQLIVGAGSVRAQTMRVTLNVSAHPNPYVAAWATRRDVAIVTIFNTGPKPAAVKLGVRIYTDGALQAETQPDKLPAFTVQPGLNTFYGEDLVPASAVKFHGDVDRKVLRSGRFPSGAYRFCLQVLDAATFAPLAEEQCRPFTIHSYQSPQPLSPDDGALLAPAPTRPALRWTAVTPMYSPQQRYQVNVMEVLPGQLPAQAFQANRPILDRSVTGTPQLIWPADVPLDAPMTYVWSVRALDDAGNPLGESQDGWGTPRSFTVRNAATVAAIIGQRADVGCFPAYPQDCRKTGYGCLVMFPWPETGSPLRLRDVGNSSPTQRVTAYVNGGDRPTLNFEFASPPTAEWNAVRIDYEIPLDSAVAGALGVNEITIVPGEYLKSAELGRFGGIRLNVTIGQTAGIAREWPLAVPSPTPQPVPNPPFQPIPPDPLPTLGPAVPTGNGPGNGQPLLSMMDTGPRAVPTGNGQPNPFGPKPPDLPTPPLGSVPTWNGAPYVRTTDSELREVPTGDGLPVLPRVNRMDIGSQKFQQLDLWSIARNSANMFDSAGIKHNIVVAELWNSPQFQQMAIDYNDGKPIEISAYVRRFFHEAPREKPYSGFNPDTVLALSATTKSADDWLRLAMPNPSRKFMQYATAIRSAVGALPTGRSLTSEDFTPTIDVESTILADKELTQDDRRALLILASGERYSAAFWNRESNSPKMSFWKKLKERWKKIRWGEVGGVDGIVTLFGGSIAGGCASVVDVVGQLIFGP